MKNKYKTKLFVSIKSYLLFIIIFCASEAKAQFFFNLQSHQVNQYVNNLGGILKKSDFQNNPIFKSKVHELIFKFSHAATLKTDIILMAFYFTMDDKCSHYIIIYKSSKFLKNIIKEINNYNFHRISDKYLWINKEMQKISISGINNSQQLSNGFVLNGDS